MNSDLNILQRDAIGLLKELIATPSFSKEEEKTAGIIAKFLQKKTSLLHGSVITYLP